MRGRHQAPRRRWVSSQWIGPWSLVMVLFMSSVAWADDISNNLDPSIDAIPELVSVTVGASTSVGLYVQPQNSDGKNGCNFTGPTTTLVVSVNSSNPGVATASPSSITFGSCGDTPAITVTGLAAGSSTVSLAQVSNTTAGSFNLLPATFIVTVTAPAPTDTTPPVVSPSIVGTLGNDGWYVSDVIVTWSVSDAESAITSTTGCGTTTLTADTAGLTLTCSATSAGGTSSQTVTIYRDATAPGIVASRSPEPNSEGWNNTPVLVTFACTDLTSGVAVCGPDQTVSTEGAGQSVTGTATDHAGNSDTATVANIDIDLTAPAVSFAGGPVDGGVYYFGSVPAAPSCDATDTLSGVSAAGCGVSGYSSSVGVHTMTAAASDRAGNTTSVERTYTVLAWTLTGFYRPVDMPVTTLDMVYNTVKGGSTVPLKFEVFAGPTELTTTSTILSFGVVRLTCVSGAPEDAIEVTTTGSTSLRYDSDSGQFVQNWQTPKTAGSCYKVTLVTQDGSTVIAYFKTK